MLIRSKAALRVSFCGGGTDVSPYPEEKGAKTIALTGKNGGELAKIVDLVLKVPSNDTPRIQEAHITILHIICYLVEKRLFD